VEFKEHEAHQDHHGHDHHDHGDRGHDHHDHKSHESVKKKKKTHNLSLVSSVGFTIEGLLDVPLFNAFMSTLLAAKAADLYRTKGVLAFANQGDSKFVFQGCIKCCLLSLKIHIFTTCIGSLGVHEQINFGPSDQPWRVDEVRQSKMVFIGKNIDYEFLKTSLTNCCVDPVAAKIIMHKRA